MLISLTVNHFTLVEHLDMEFEPGMTAITGETGAGKSLVLDALGMALGDRGDTGRIRPGAGKLDVTATFGVAGNPRARAWLEEREMLDEETCILRRTLSAEGRSRGFINGQPAPMQQLQELGEMMIDIHSQHEHQSLLVRDTHRRLLDAFAGCDPLAREVADLYQRWRDTARKLHSARDDARENDARRELLAFQIQELDELNPTAGEVEELEKEQHLLANAEQILTDSHRVLALCKEGEEGDASSLLGRALHLLQAMPEKTPALDEAESMLNTALIQVDEAAREVQRHMDSFDLDPARLQTVEERLSLIYQLVRKHRVQPTELPALHRDLQDELARLDASGEGHDALQQRLAALEEELTTLEGKLTAQRQKAAAGFSEAVSRQLAELAMDNASLNVALTPLDGHSAQGAETVEFLVSTNPGQPHKPLSKVASGGELSRISLAIQVIAARHTDIPTLVFDEVDVGVGGAVAEVVGRLLRQLGEYGQVICVTHLPQVASCAHHHLLASKASDKGATESQLAQLVDGGRVEEIARMLGGSKITAQTRAHAEEMLELSAR